MDFSKWGSEFANAVHGLFGQWSLSTVFRTLVVIALLTMTIQAARLILLAVARNRVSAQTKLVINKLFAYGGFVATVLVFFGSLGVNLTAVLGAAGIVGIAVGFAAQSSVANVIAGLFLLAEKPFSVGDVINAADVAGVVLSVDILSVKIKTFDNMLVRIPNEVIAKAKVINITRFPIRRLDFDVPVSYGGDLRRSCAVIRETIAANRYALANPEPFLLVKGLGPSSIDIAVGIWFEKNDLVALKNSIVPEILERFRAEGIEIPFPQVTVHHAAQ